MRTSLTKKAAKDLNSIKSYISKDKPSAAKTVLKKILATIRHLEDHPHMGRTGVIRNTRELVISNTPFIVFYRISAKAILILRVVHGARQWPC